MSGSNEGDTDPAPLSVGTSGPEVVVEDLERKDFVRYAGASGDFNPLHYDDTYAKEAGYREVFGQGMFTAGLASRVAADWFGIANVDRFRVRFESQVRPGDTLVATGEVTERKSVESGVEVDAALRVENQDGETVLSGDVTATLTD